MVNNLVLMKNISVIISRTQKSAWYSRLLEEPCLNLWEWPEGPSARPTLADIADLFSWRDTQPRTMCKSLLGTEAGNRTS